jgi:hypothetical protein
MKIMTLKQYIKEVDKAVSSIAGLSVHDLADFDFSSAHEEGASPRQTAEQILEEEGFYK